MTQERFQYCKSLGYDVLTLTDLWRSAPKFADDTCRWTFGSVIKDHNGNVRFPNDKTSGVGILLSDRAMSKYLSHGSPCESITWVLVKLKDPVVNLFITTIYLPHRVRLHPAQSDTIASLVSLLAQVPANDCVVVLGDFNEQLPSNMEGLTGKWTHDSPSPNANSILDFVRMHSLFTVKTNFQFPSGKNTSTYITADKLSKEALIPLLEQDLTNRKIKVKYRGKWIGGKVVKRTPESGFLSEKTWIANFNDGYTNSYTATHMENWLLPLPTTGKKELQLDYILVSSRWRSSVIDSKVCWGPSLHRNVYGRADHALVSCRWRCRLRPYKSRPSLDWALLLQEESSGRPTTAPQSPVDTDTSTSTVPSENPDRTLPTTRAPTTASTPPPKRARANPREDSSEDGDSDEDEEDNNKLSDLVPMSCDRCGHVLCGRQVWLSPDSPVTKYITTCGSSVTPAGRI